MLLIFVLDLCSIDACNGHHYKKEKLSIGLSEETMRQRILSLFELFKILLNISLRDINF